MTKTRPKPVVPDCSRWQPELRKGKYDCSHALSAEERAAIRSFLDERVKPGGLFRRCCREQERLLQRLVGPISDAFALFGSLPSKRRATVAILLGECGRAGTSFWAWTHDDWVDVLGRNSAAFRERNEGHASQGVRLNVVAVAYLHGLFRDVMALGDFQRVALATRVFGAESVEAARRQVVEPLAQWGYVTGRALDSGLCEALLQNESPCLEALTSEVLDSFRRKNPAGKRSIYFQLAKVLSLLGFVEKPLPVALHPQSAVNDEGLAGISAEWWQWTERWSRTSTLESRNRLRFYLRKAGRWLAVQHSEVVSPALWTREICAEYVAVVTHMCVGDLAIRKGVQPRKGQPLSPNSVADQLSAVRTFFRDCQEWGWIPRRFDPGRSLALPRSVKARIGPRPRVIADNLWARLLSAGLQLEEADLPCAGREGVQCHAYPVEYIKALAVVWLFAALRSDEISRLRVGCVRWQQPCDSASAGPVCLLDIPVNKTSTDFAKPVDPLVGRAIEAWEAVRPQQPKLADRKTGEHVDLLFMHRARSMRREILTESVIPMLCRKAGIPTEDVRGAITSHRARATIASQLFNTRDPMSLFQLQAWLGHRSPASTQHYVAITPTTLANAYSNAGYFERNARTIKVLIDQDTMRQANPQDAEAWRYYDLGHGLCAYEFFDQCAHRMACARCDFYQPRHSALVQLLDAKQNILHLLQAIPLTDTERAVVDGDLAAIERLTSTLADLPTPSGQTPTELHRSNAPSSNQATNQPDKVSRRPTKPGDCASRKPCDSATASAGGYTPRTPCDSASSTLLRNVEEAEFDSATQKPEEA